MDEMREAIIGGCCSLDETGAAFAPSGHHSDVLCMQSLPELPQICAARAFAAAPEHAASRYCRQGWTGCYFHAGVTFWNVPARKRCAKNRGARPNAFPQCGDQLTLNEVISHRLLEQVVVLPSQYNFRRHYHGGTAAGRGSRASMAAANAAPRRICGSSGRDCIQSTSELSTRRAKRRACLVEEQQPPIIGLAHFIHERRIRFEEVIGDARQLPFRQPLANDECMQLEELVLREARKRVVEPLCKWPRGDCGNDLTR